MKSYLNETFITLLCLNLRLSLKNAKHKANQHRGEMHLGLKNTTTSLG